MVGINTAIVSPQIGQGIGFAVPISLAKPLLPQLEKGSKIARGYLGVTVGDLTPELARGFGLGEGREGRRGPGRHRRRRRPTRPA